MAEFFFPPEWANAPPPKVPEVDPHRIEGLANRFIAASHGALHTAPDAFYGKAGADAVDAAPAAAAQLSALRDATLELARDEHEHRALADRLEPYHSLALDDIDRHIAEQRDVLARQNIAERQDLIRRAAGLKLNEDALGGLAEANASAERSLARLDGVPGEPVMQAARSAIWRSAIDQRLAAGEGRRALGLFERAKDDLVPADRRALDVPIQAARTDLAADQWIEREADNEGEPLATRLQADSSLSPVERATVLAKIGVRDSAWESARIVTVKGLDDRRDATTRTLATAPATYRPGTLANIADGYDAAGEPDKANSTRRLALQESFLSPFSQSGVAAQQRLIDRPPDGEVRATAQAIQRQQSEAFAKDAFTAGTALYPNVGPPAPIDDLAGRIGQARTISAYRGIPVAPFTAHEIAAMRRQLAEGTPQQREALLAQVNALPEDMKAALVMSDAAGDQQAMLTPRGSLDPPPPPPKPHQWPKPPRPRPRRFPPDFRDDPEPPEPPPDPGNAPPPGPGNEIS